MLSRISDLEKDSPLLDLVLPLYQRYVDGVSVREIMGCAERLREQELKEVI